MKNLVEKYLWNTFTPNNYHTTFKRDSIDFFKDFGKDYI